MKKGIFTRFAAAALMLAAVACQNEDMLDNGAQNGTSVERVPLTITATLENGQTKTALQEGGKVYWENGDAMTVLAVGEDATVTSYQFTTKDEGAEATFTNENDVALAENYYAVYPHTDKDRLPYLNDKAISSWGCSVVDSKLKVYFPSLQKVSADGTTGFDAYCVGVVAEEGTVAMKNLGGLIKINIPVEGIEHVILYGNAGETIVGNAYVTFGEDGLPVISSVDGSNMVRIVPASGKTFAIGEYYINVLPVTFSNGLSVVYTKSDDTWASVRSSKEFVVMRSMISELPAVSNLNFDGKVVDAIAVNDAGGSVSTFSSTPPNTSNDTSKGYANKVTEWTLKNTEYIFKIYCSYAFYKTGGSGLCFGKNAGDYLEVPSINGYALNKVVVRTSVTDKPAGSPQVQNSDGVPVQGGQTWSGDKKPYGIEHVWSFNGVGNTAYRLAQTVSSDYSQYHQVRLYYAPAPNGVSSIKPLITSVTTAEPETDPTNGKATLNGSFTAVDCNSSAVTCGFDYKLVSEQEWTSVSCPQATSEFSYELTASSSEDYVYRAWTKVNKTDKTVYGEEVQFNPKKLVLHLVLHGEEGKKLLVDTWKWGTNGNNSSTKKDKDMNNLTYNYTYNGVDYPFTFWSLQEGVDANGAKVTSGGYCMRASSNPTVYHQLALNNLAKEVSTDGHPAWMQFPCPASAKLVEIDCDLHNNFKGVISKGVNDDGRYTPGTEIASYDGNDSFPMALDNTETGVRYYFTTEHLNIPRINTLTLTYLYVGE